MNVLINSILIFAVAFVVAYYLTKKFISRFHAGGHVVKDMYKPERPNVPTMGGVPIMAGVMFGLIAAQLLIDPALVTKLLIFYFVVFIYGIFGLIDDLVRVKSRWKRVYLLYILALPIALLNVGEYITFNPLDLKIHVGWLKPYVIAPLYVMVVSNMINMHAGFNGLSGGLSWILMFFIGLKVVISRDITQVYYLLPIFGALLAFMWYNKYPSRIFLGNSGTQLLGAAVGGLLILYNLEIYGIIILIPHIVNFIMWVYWLANMRIQPHVKFAKVRDDGTIEPPNKLTVKYTVTHYFRVRELQATIILYGLTGVFGVIALMAT